MYEQPDVEIPVEIPQKMTQKMLWLYAMYDNLLNISNKNYFGIIQELNTNELIVKYQCLTGLSNCPVNGYCK